MSDFFLKKKKKNVSFDQHVMGCILEFSNRGFSNRALRHDGSVPLMVSRGERKTRDTYKLSM